MKNFRNSLIGLCVVAGFLGGCASTGNLAPVEDRGQGAGVPLEVQDLPPEPAPVAETIPFQANPAIASLLRQARTARENENYAAADGFLERGLRIEPQNAYLWSELAVVRGLQQQWEQANQLATKSNALAAGDSVVQARNWRTIGNARRQQGDGAGARAAYERARELQSSETDPGRRFQ